MSRPVLHAPILAVAGVLALTSAARADAKTDTFWRWFGQHEETLFTFEKDQDRVFDELDKALAVVHPDLTFELGPVTNGRREFVISAGGLKVAFPAVETLHASAPKLPRWIFIKFRPRRSPINDVQFGGLHIRARDVNYHLIEDDDPRKLGIVLFLDGYDATSKSLGQIGFLFLDEALGEYTLETRVGRVVFESRASKHFRDALPLKELPADFDETYRKQQQRAAKHAKPKR